VIPAPFIRLPASINIGIASNAKFCDWETESCMGIVIGRLGFCRKKINPDIPIAKATGIPVRRNNINAHMTNSIFKFSLRELRALKVIYFVV
jgi:hypothetical protein